VKEEFFPHVSSFPTPTHFINYTFMLTITETALNSLCTELKTGEETSRQNF